MAQSTGPGGSPPDLAAEAPRRPGAVFHTARAGAAASRLRFILASYLIAGGVASFLGWPLDLPRLADWDRNGIAIQPNTCVCVVLGGIALWILTRGGRRGAVLCAAGIAAIGGLTLAEWTLGVRFGLDEPLLFDRAWGRVGVDLPGRMSPAGSASWLVLAGAIALSASRGIARRWAPRLALITLSLAFLSIVGYLYKAVPLYSVPHLTLVALQTCTFLVALSAGVIAGVPEHEPMRTLLDAGSAGMLARRGLPVLVIAPVLAGFVQIRAAEAGSLEPGMAAAILVLTLTGLLTGTQWWLLAAVRRHEQLLRGSDARTSLAAEATGLVSWEWDQRTDRLVTHGTARDLFGVEEISDSGSLFDLIVSEDRPAHLQRFWDVASEGGEYLSEYRVRRPDDGRVLWLEERGRALLNANGTVERIVGVTFDATQRRHAQELLLREPMSDRRMR